MELFEEQVKKQPSAVALIPDGAPVLSYAEMNRAAEQVANEILSVGVSIGDVAILILDRSGEGAGEGAEEGAEKVPEKVQAGLGC